MTVPVWLSPYEHFEACQAAFLSRWPDEGIQWYFGPNEVAKNTQEMRVVYVPQPDCYDDLTDRFIGGLSLGPDGSEDDQPDIMQWDFVSVQVHCFGLRSQLFTLKGPDGKLQYGLKDRAATIIRKSVVGPKNVKLGKSQYKLRDFSDLPEALHEWILVFNLPVPLFKVPEGSTVSEPISAVEISSEDV